MSFKKSLGVPLHLFYKEICILPRGKTEKGLTPKTPNNRLESRWKGRGRVSKSLHNLLDNTIDKFTHKTTNFK